MSNQKFEVGDRVSTPAGVGKVVFWRFGSPDYSQVVAYGVLLDSKRDQYTYSGTIFPYNDVKEEKK